MLNKQKMLEKFWEDAVNYFSQHKDLSITQCAKDLGVSRDTLAKYLKEYNRYEIRGIYDVNENYFDVIDTEEKAYWLGLLTADGCIFKSSNGIRLSLMHSDHNHVEKFKKSIESEHPIEIRKSGGYSDTALVSTLTITNKHLHQALINLGFSSVKTLNERPAKQIPEHLIHHYIRGIFDGDGWITYGYNYREIGFGMGKDILEYIKDIFERLAGVKTTYKVKFRKNVYIYRISAKQEILKALNFMYSDATIYLDRKYNRYLNFCRLVSKTS
jgi:hypothetical protein